MEPMKQEAEPSETRTALLLSSEAAAYGPASYLTRCDLI